MLFKEEEFNEKEALILNEAQNNSIQVFEDDDVAMGCSQNCWATCIGTCRWNSH